jgi:hypothetical protein
MNLDDLNLFYIYLHRTINWDPPPIWWKLNQDQLKQFTEVQNRFNAKMAEIQAQKITEIAKIAGVSEKIAK